MFWDQTITDVNTSWDQLARKPHFISFFFGKMDLQSWTEISRHTFDKKKMMEDENLGPKFLFGPNHAPSPSP